MNESVKTALIIGGVIVALLVALPLLLGASSGWQGAGPGMMGPWMMGGFGWGWFMPVFMLLFWGLVIWAVVALVRGLGQPGPSDSAPGHTDSALDILRKRYARGEMNKEEYEEKKRDLA